MANSPQNRDAVIEVDLSKGIDADSLEKQGMSWAQNIEYRVNRIEVRGGFGTLSQFGTTLNAGRQEGGTYGYGPPLGATLQVTNQGHVQILSLHQLSSYTGTLQGQWLPNLYALSVYDITTGRRAEHVFRSQTQWVDNMDNAALPSFDQPMWRQLPDSVVPIFVQLNDLQYIVLPTQGVWVYRPIDPYAIDQRLQTVPGALQNGDSAWVEQVLPVNGIFKDAGAVYFTSSTFPVPTCACSFQNRMVYANGRKLYFSDPDRPDNVQANSFYQVPTERPITAIASVKGVILAFTMDETWMYQPNDPSQTGLISGGNIYNLSRSIGCLTAQSLTLMQDSVVFMDRRGVYVTDGGTGIQKISENIDTWFALPEQIQNPLSNYLTQLGLNTLTNQQPRAFIDLQSQLYRSTMTWDPLNQLLYVTFDDISLVYCPNFGWSVYLYETTAVMVDGDPEVGVQQRIIDPILFAHAGELYMIGGPERQAYAGFMDSSVYILKAGRGGALDRSSVTQEDNRQPQENWSLFGNAIDDLPRVWIAPPLLLPDRFKTDTQTMFKPTWLVPVYASNSLTYSSTSIDGLRVQFGYDETNWQIVLLAPGDTHYDYILPAQRLGSRYAYIDMEETAPGTVQIKWDGPSVTSPTQKWTTWPSMALDINVPQPLVYLLFQRRDGSEDVTSVSPNFTGQFTVFNYNGEVPILGNLYICNSASRPSYPEQDLGDNTHAQPVDWAISTPLIGDGNAQYKARGAYTTLQSYGTADVTEQQVPGWYIGTYASMTTSDYKDFAAQRIDWDNQDPHEVVDKESVRRRFEALNSAEPIRKAGANDPLVDSPKWSSTTDQASGNLLIDDAATDTIAGSEGVRGERFRTMLFGCMNSNGEDIKIARVRILTRVTGGLRRSGRAGLT